MAYIDWLFSAPKGVLSLCLLIIFVAFIVAFISEKILAKTYYQNDESWQEKEAREKREKQESE